MNDKEHYSGDDDSHDKITNIDELLEHIMNMFSQNIIKDGGKPVVHGFTIINQPGKKPVIFGFRGQKEEEEEEENQEPAETKEEFEEDFYIFNRDPLIEVFEVDDKVFLLADLGVEEENVEYYPNRDHVELTVITSGTGYSRIIDLPCDVKPESMATSYRNGILQLVFENAALE